MKKMSLIAAMMLGLGFLGTSAANASEFTRFLHRAGVLVDVPQPYPVFVQPGYGYAQPGYSGDRCCHHHGCAPRGGYAPQGGYGYPAAPLPGAGYSPSYSPAYGTMGPNVYGYGGNVPNSSGYNTFNSYNNNVDPFTITSPNPYRSAYGWRN